MDNDKLNMTHPVEAMRVAYDVLDRLQDHTPHGAVVATAILLQEMSAVLRIPITELLDKADRITRDLNEHYQPEIKALREYIKKEMR